MTDTLDLLEDRIADLERKVFGRANPSTSYAEIPSTPATESLIQTSRILNAVTAGHDKTSSLFNRLNELNNLVDMSCDDSSIAAKLEIILVKEQELQSALSQLEQARRLAATVLDNPQATDNLKAVNNLSGRLDKLSILTMNSLEDYNTLNDSVQELFDRYNTIVSDLTRSFILFDELVSAKEVVASVAKVLD